MQAATRNSLAGPSELVPVNDTATFLNRYQLIDRNASKRFLLARRPEDFYKICPGCFSHTEMQAQIVLRVIARAAHHLCDLRVAPGDYSDTCADGTAIRTSSSALNHQPTIPVSAVVAKNRWSSIEVVYDDIDITIIVNVAERAASPNCGGLNSGSRICRYVFE